VSGYLYDLNHGAEVALQALCTQRGWRSQRLGSDLYLFEDLSETLVRVDNDLVRRLLRSDLSASLRQALAQAVTAGSRRELPAGLCDCRNGYVVALDMLGVRLDVLCDHEACADGVRSYYSALYQPAPTASAEVVVRCSWPVADRYLFRARRARQMGHRWKESPC